MWPGGTDTCFDSACYLQGGRPAAEAYWCRHTASCACFPVDFTLKALNDAMATAKSFPDAVQSLADTWTGGLENVGLDIVNDLAKPVGLPNELKALTNALHMIGSTFNTSTGNH